MRMHNADLSLDIRFGLFLVLFLLSLPVLAESPVIWKIGTFDRSSGEFRSQDIDYASSNSDPIFVIGKSGEADWYRFQPGPANGMTGGRLHPFTVKFALNNVPRGVYTLKLAVLYETPRLSFLRLSINGHTGFFYFHPKLDFKAGDWEGTFVPQTSYDEKNISIPAEWLRKGENMFVFTAMDSPRDSQSSLGAIAPGHTGIVYDALELDQDFSGRYAGGALTAQIVPSIFYRDSGRGLTEVVDVFLHSGRWPKSVTARLRLAGRTYTKTVSTNAEFGEQRLEFDVPEWSGDAEASVAIGSRSTQPAKVTPSKKWTVDIIPHEHLDVGFTDYAAKVAELHSQSIDAAMGLIEKTPDFKWTLDGSWVAEQYLAGRGTEAQQKFLDQVRKGNIVIPPEYANQHTGNASWEGLARSFYDSHRLRKDFNLPSSAGAQIVDVPSYTWGYASLLHDAGIKYFIAGSNSWRAPVMLHGRWNEKSPFYWEGPDGGRVLMWYSRAYLQAGTLFGSPWRMEAIRDALPVFLQAYSRPDYTAATAIVFGTQLENTPLAKEQSEIVAQFSAKYAWPRLEYSTVQAALQKIESEWKGDIPVYRGDFGPYWEDGYGSDAYHTAIHRENQHRITTAEVLGTAASAVDPMVRPDRSLLSDAWRNELLYDEHTWTYVGATTQPEHHQSADQIALKGSRARRAQHDIDESIQRGWAQMEALFKPKDNSISVFNSLNWSRSGLVETDIPEGSKLVESTTSRDVPFEVLFKGKGIPLPGFGPGHLRIRFVAEDVPAVGYKLYTVRTNNEPATSTEDLPGNVFENQFYRLTLDPPSGAITSIFDKQLNRELVDPAAPFKFGSYLYVTGGDDYPNNSLYRFGASLKPPKLTIHPAEAGKTVSAKKTPIGIVVKVVSSAPNTPMIETEILLLNSDKKILLTYRVRKDRVLTRESAYITFPFALHDPAFSYGSQTAWVNPAKDELPGGSREWYLPTTWAAVYNRQVAAALVPLDAPLTTFGDIVRAEWPTEFKPKRSYIFSWLMNNYWGTNFPAWQGGEYTFRYAITSDATFDPAKLTRFGWNYLTPLERDDVAGSQDASTLPATQASLLEIGSPNVTLLTWKPAEDGNGSILRIQESAGSAAELRIRSDFIRFQKAWLCNALEDNQSELAPNEQGVLVSIKPFQVLTIRVTTAPIPR